MAAALVHDPGTLDDPRLRDAVLQAVRLAVVRLGLAAEAAAQAEQLAASRRRLVTAATRERDRFAADVQAGPGALLTEAAAALDAAVRVAPPGLEALLAAAAADLDDTREALTTAVGGELPERLAADGLDGALVELARRAGATADVRVDAPVAPQVAAGAWYCASEALANALKHAGAARIALSARLDDGRLVLAVTDDGPGGADPSGGGLAGLRSRAAAVGGELTIDSPPGRRDADRDPPAGQLTLRQAIGRSKTACVITAHVAPPHAVAEELEAEGRRPRADADRRFGPEQRRVAVHQHGADLDGIAGEVPVRPFRVRRTESGRSRSGRDRPRAGTTRRFRAATPPVPRLPR